MRRYLVLFLIALGLGVMVARSGGRLPAMRPAPLSHAPDSIAVALTLTEHGVQPERVTVAKDHLVVLTIVNHRRLASGVSLQGYQDVFSPGILPPGASWQGRFLADRPGDEFAWMVEGEPAGRFVVTGSHLVEGHR